VQQAGGDALSRVQLLVEIAARFACYPLSESFSDPFNKYDGSGGDAAFPSICSAAGTAIAVVPIR